MSGLRTGLDYAGVESVLRLHESSLEPAALFAGLQVMELVTLQIWAKDAERQRQQDSSKTKRRS